LGQILASQPISAPSAASAWRVLYRSRGIDGRPIGVSGMIIRPAGKPPAHGWPIISWAHGTTGSADRCAPSKDGAATVDGLNAMLRAGYVVAATDYEGLGTPGPHPYLVGPSEGRSVLDAARAARALIPEATGGVAVWGHSQGGQAALWAGELAADYAPELAVAGVAAFAPAARFRSFMSDTATPLLAGFEVAAAAGLAAVHPELRLADVLNADALSRIGVLETGCIAEVVVTFAVLEGGVLVPGGLDRPEWQAAVLANEAGARRSVPPVLVMQGQNDQLVRPAVADQYQRVACAAGSAVDVRRYSNADHGSVLTEGRADAFAWTSDRLGGRPLGKTC
jgi:acetyl esterase/lipase